MNEKSFDIQGGFCGSFDEFTAKLAGHCCPLLLRYLSFVSLITLVPNKHEYGITAFNAAHWLAESFQPFKCGSGGYRIDEDKTLSLSTLGVSDKRLKWAKMRPLPYPLVSKSGIFLCSDFLVYQKEIWNDRRYLDQQCRLLRQNTCGYRPLIVFDRHPRSSDRKSGWDR